MGAPSAGPITQHNVEVICSCRKGGKNAVNYGGGSVGDSSGGSDSQLWILSRIWVRLTLPLPQDNIYNLPQSLPVEMEGNNFAERLTYKKRGDFDLEELEKLHKFLIGEIAAHFGAPAAVKVTPFVTSPLRDRVPNGVQIRDLPPAAGPWQGPAQPQLRGGSARPLDRSPSGRSHREVPPSHLSTLPPSTSSFSLLPSLIPNQWPSPPWSFDGFAGSCCTPPD